MFQEEGQVWKDMDTQEEWLHMALMCSFPQDEESEENTD